jgi:hypothetical protein
MDEMTVRGQADALTPDTTVTVTTSLGETFTGQLAWSTRGSRDIGVRVNNDLIRTPLTCVTGIEAHQ